MAIEIKQYDPKIEQRTVVDNPTIEERREPFANLLVMQVAETAQSITPWGVAPSIRDKQLRSFWHSEPWLASVVYSVSIRNASFKWEIVGSNPEKPQPKNTARAVERILKNSNRGKGWIDLITQTCIDLYCQDNGAFWEIIRTKNRPDAPVINIAHLDAGQCTRTGDPEYPIIYHDRYGKEKILRWWQVRTIEEFPSPVESAFGLQYSAVSRALLAAEIIQSIAVYKMEKVSGRFTKALDIVSGVTQRNIDDALGLAEEQSLNKMLYRYSLPVILPGIDPTTSLSHIHIDLASLPDNFDEDTSFKWYVAQLAAAFGVDYQEIAPLMTGSLGSSQQSEIMHLKTRGKGPALIMSKFEDLINGGLIPANVEFRFLEQDIRSEREKAETTFTRAKARAMMIKSGELTIQGARELAVKAGDIPRYLAEEMELEGDTNPEQPTDEFGPTQVGGGMDTQMTMQDVKTLRKMISNSPTDFLQRYKASFGQPSCTVVSYAFNQLSNGFNRVQNELMAKYANSRARFLQEGDYHITLVYSPLADEMEIKVLDQFTTQLINEFPLQITCSKLSYFDTENGQAIVLLVDENDQLKMIQRLLYDKFESMGMPLSDYSKPTNWTPHITLAYVEKGATEEVISPIRMTLSEPVFTRSDYRVVGEARLNEGNYEIEDD